MIYFIVQIFLLIVLCALSFYFGSVRGAKVALQMLDSYLSQIDNATEELRLQILKIYTEKKDEGAK